MMKLIFISDFVVIASRMLGLTRNNQGWAANAKLLWISWKSFPIPIFLLQIVYMENLWQAWEINNDISIELE